MQNAALYQPTTGGATRVLGRSYLAEGVLLIFGLLTLGVFEPQLHVKNFNELQLGETVADISTANPYNQLRWLALAGLASWIVLARGPDRLLRATVLVWPLLVLLGYCLLSTVWSDYPDITLRRAFGLILPAYSLLIALAYVDEPRRAALVLYLAFWFALFLNLAVLPLPSAYDEFGFFRGALGNKNTLGSVAVPALLVGMAVGCWIDTTRGRVLRLAYLGAWLAILIFSVSRTSWALVIAVPCLFLFLNIASYALRLRFVIVGVCALALAAAAVGIAYGVLGHSPIDLVAPGTTFNGRTEIWSFMMQQIGNGNLLIGTGFGAFWGVGYGAANLSSIYTYIHLLNQAHNGYIDVVAALGVAGLTLLFLVFLSAASAAESFRRTDPQLFRLVWFLLLFALLHNAMESSALVHFNPVWHLTLFAMIVAFLQAPQGRVK